MRSFSTGCLAIILFCAPSAAQIGFPAGDSPNEVSASEVTLIDPNTYGTTSETSHAIGAYEFQAKGAGPGDVLGSGDSFSRYVQGTGSAVAPFLLPAGAMIVGHGIEYCDFTTTAEVQGIISSCLPGGDGGCSQLAPPIGTGVAAAPGCVVGILRVNLTSPLTVNNASNSYIYQVSSGSGGVLARFRTVRIYYKLQVSPAPSTATFPNDVPTTHPFFRFIEALAAAGITSGCAPGSFCPDAPITRGQMAVFLSAALGLHFAP